MRHFVQYHNPERMGRFESDGSSFGIQTDKPVDKLLGDRVWLITSEPGRPRRYLVCETFVVDTIDRNPSGPRKNLALGRHGKLFDPMVRIDDAGWFKGFLRSKANFSLGLSQIDSDVADQLLKCTSVAVSPGQPRRSGRGPVGAGFGNAEANREIESAAIQAVQDVYESTGWAVHSVERENMGYDLHCNRSTEVEHVEVKGIRGGLCSFVITANELAAARTDPLFKLCAVLRTLDASGHEIRTFSGEELCASFRFEPLSYFAKPTR